MSATLEKPKPGLAAALLIPFLIWLVASIVAVVFAVMGFSRAEEVADDLARFPAGQDAQVELRSAGEYRIWLDRPGADADVGVSASGTVTGPDGEEVPVATYVGSLEWNDLEAVLTFTAPEPGTYTFNVTEDDFSSSGGTVPTTDTEFAVGKDNPLSEVGKGFALMAIIGGLGFLIALILMIIMLVRRGRSKKRITQAAMQSGAYGGYGAPGGGYGAPGGGYPPPGGYQQPGSSW